MDWRVRITFEPGKRGGKPCVRDLRITVTDVLEYLASGMSEDEILRDFPDLTREDIRACLAFAADRERKFVSVPPASGCSSTRTSRPVSSPSSATSTLARRMSARSACRLLMTTP